MSENTDTGHIRPGSVLNGRYIVVQINGGTILAADQRLVGRMWKIAESDDEGAGLDAVDRFTTGGRWYEVYAYKDVTAKAQKPAHYAPKTVGEASSLDSPSTDTGAKLVGEASSLDSPSTHAGAQLAAPLAPPIPPSRRAPLTPLARSDGRGAGSEGKRKPNRIEWIMTAAVAGIALVAFVLFLLVLNKPADKTTATPPHTPGNGSIVQIDGTAKITVPIAIQATMTSYANDLNVVNQTIVAETPLPTASLTTNSDGAHDGTSWPTFGGALDQTRVSKTGPKAPQIVWNYDATRTATGTQNVQIYGSAAIGSDGTTYIGTNDGTLLALDGAGKQKWSAKTGDAIVSAPAIGSNGIIYVASTDDSLYAFDLKDGHKLWAFPTFGEIYSAPVVFEGVVYIGSRDGNLWAVDAQGGTKRWSFATDKGIADAPAIVATPTIYGGLIYIGSVGGKMYALDKSGKAKWTVEANSAITGSAAIVGGTLYFGAENGHFYANDAATGSHTWEVTVPGKIRFSSPAVAGGLVYVGSGDNTLYAYDAASGALKWKFATGGPISTSPVVAGFGSDLALATVYIGSNDRNVYGLNAQTGQRVWSYTTDNLVIASPAVVGERLIIGSTDGHIYAFGSK